MGANSFRAQARRPAMGGSAQEDLGPLSKASLHMVELRARDWPAMCQFYGSTLGLHLAMRDDGAGFAMFGRAAPYVAVIRKDAGAGPSRVVTDFALDDLDAALAELERRGVEVLAPAKASAEGYRIAKIADPEGNEIHLFEWTKPAALPS